MLTLYRKKRDFKKTTEPSGKSRPRSTSRLSYVIQKHAASHLHYDFRLELDGVLRSWAVPKGPSLDPDRKSLAVEVEDHPLEYGGFEGTIPKGQYGGGSVLLWDQGTWEPLDDPHEGLKKGKLHFALHGQKLKGEWTLVRFHGQSEKEKRNWLLIKSRDSFASADKDILAEQPQSVKSNRLIEAINGDKVTWQANRSEQSDDAPSDSMPTDISPQLATWEPQPPAGDQWLHEVKLDGYRLIVRVNNGGVQLITRGGEDWTHRFERLAGELSKIPGQAILDGEVVVVDEQGRSQFQLLQNFWKKGGNSDPVIYVFDLLYLNGHDLREQPLIERKKQLKKLIDDLDAPRVKYNDHVKGNGDAVVDAACKMALEGIISKRADARYVGGRTRTWLKSKCGYRQEFIIIGYTDPQGGRQEFGALLLGYHDKKDHKLIYAGRVGTGFDAGLLKKIKQQMKAHERSQPPTDVAPSARERRQAHWLEPRLVAEVKFAGWTSDNLLRQATFLGLREDKKAAQVVREDQAAPKLTQRRVKSPVHQDETIEDVPKTLELTHPDRILFPGTQVTKLRLAEYYEMVAGRMLPHVVERPLTLVRCPGGIGGPSFIQRHFTGKLPPAIKSISTAETGASELHMRISDAAGLRGLVQINAIEIHAWGSTPGDIERPDRLVFDLDPDTSLSWARIVKAARELEKTLRSVKLRVFIKTTGGKGLHLVVPIKPTVTWDQAKAFSKSISEELARQDKKSYTINIRKAERNGRVFIDYLRNGRSATSVVPYSVRAREGAPVSMPVEWDEIGSLKAANLFTVENAQRQLKRATDPWANFESDRVDLHQVIGA